MGKGGGEFKILYYKREVPHKYLFYHIHPRTLFLNLNSFENIHRNKQLFKVVKSPVNLLFDV